MSESQRRVRMGTVSLFALVMIISLSVMAALSAATAKASEAQTDTQAVFLTDTYANESAAQSAVAVIDAQLAACAQTGEGAAGGASALAERAARAAQDAGYAAAAEGPYVAMGFRGSIGQALACGTRNTCRLHVSDNAMESGNALESSRRQWQRFGPVGRTGNGHGTQRHVESYGAGKGV